MKIAPAHISLINKKRSFISILVGILLCCPASLFAYQIVAETGYFTLNGNYQYYHDVNKNYPYLRLSARYNATLK